MNINFKGKLKHIISIQMSDIIPFIIDAIKEELNLDESIEVHYTSTTKFLTFNIIMNSEQEMLCNCNKCISERCKTL